MLQFMVLCIIFASFSACFPQDEVFSLRLALSGNPSTLDPHATTETLTFQVLRSIYDTLLEPDEQGQLQPALARSWEISPDNLSIILNLRKDVSFHDGSPFDGSDVIGSIERLQSPEFASPSSGEFEAIEDIVLVDDFTVRIVLKVPKASLLYTLASGWAAILPSEGIESGHNFANNPIGTGPFVFDEWIADEQISLSKNRDYWSATGEAEQVVFQIIPEPSIQVQSLISGQADILYIVNEEDIPILEASEDITIETLDSSLVVVMAINNSRAPLSDLRFRRALNFAVDKQSVLDVAYGGGTVVGTFNDAGNAFYADFSDLYPYDPEAAAQLIGETGYEAGQVLDLVLPQNFALHVQAGKLYQ
ncbi:MAG: ABC transporter substrate-binding protein, partial [Salinispira sp.]